MRLEINKIKEYIKTFWNGCRFRLIFEEDAVYIENGCFQIFVRGASPEQKRLSDKIDDEGGKIKLKLTEEERLELLKVPPDCRHCHSHTQN